MAPFNFSTTNAEVLEAFGDQVKGKTILITGPTDKSLRAQTALSRATGKPAEIILTGRNKSRIQPVIDTLKASHTDIKVTFLQIDLASNSSVREAAKNINQSVHHIDILVNNAGVMAVKDFTKTEDGLELQFAINHLGHFLFTNLIVGKILAAPRGARIARYVMSGARFDDVNFEDRKVYNPFLAYGQSKTAYIIVTEALAKRLASDGVVVLSANPGMVLGTGLMAGVTPEMGGEGYKLFTEVNGGVPPVMNPKDQAASYSNALVAILDTSLIRSTGAYLNDCVVATETLKKHATGSDKAEKLWKLSEELIGEKFEI